MDKKSSRKISRLRNILKKMEGVLIAYSGGVDSTLLLKVAKEVLQDKTLAVIASSATYPKKEMVEAKKLAEKLKVRHLVIKTRELKNPRFKDNPVNRCYFCKKELFSRLKRLAKKYHLKYVCDGSNLDDLKDFRPGAIAKRKFKIRSPLQEARLTKEDIRRISRKLRLSTWNKSSLACLASRLPYKTRISPVLLKRIDKVESYIRRLGFSHVRVRHHGNLARIEVEKGSLNRLLKFAEKISKKFKDSGYTYITLDLKGYRTGSMNEGIKNNPEGR